MTDFCESLQMKYIGSEYRPAAALSAVNSVQKAFLEAYRRDLIGTGGFFVLTEDLEKLGISIIGRNSERVPADRFPHHLLFFCKFLFSTGKTQILCYSKRVNELTRG